MKISFSFLKTVCNWQSSALMPSCQGCSSLPEVRILWLLFGSIKGLSCTWGLELMSCESHQPELRLSAKGKSETYLPPLLRRFWSTCSVPSCSGPFFPLQMLGHGLLPFNKGKVEKKKTTNTPAFAWETALIQNPRQALILLGSGAVAPTSFQQDCKRALLCASLKSRARAAFWIQAYIYMAGQKVEGLNKVSLAFSHSWLPWRTALQ